MHALMLRARPLLACDEDEEEEKEEEPALGLLRTAGCPLPPEVLGVGSGWDTPGEFPPA